MQVETRIIINSNNNLKSYLKTHSYWYKNLNRNPILIQKMKEEMEKEYKITPQDKVEKFSQSINTISNILEVLK